MNKFEKKRRKISLLSLSPFILQPLPNLLIVNKQNDYQVGSGAKFTCAKFGA